MKRCLFLPPLLILHFQIHLLWAINQTSTLPQGLSLRGQNHTWKAWKPNLVCSHTAAHVIDNLYAHTIPTCEISNVDISVYMKTVYTFIKLVHLMVGTQILLCTRVTTFEPDLSSYLLNEQDQQLLFKNLSRASCAALLILVFKLTAEHKTTEWGSTWSNDDFLISLIWMEMKSIYLS